MKRDLRLLVWLCWKQVRAAAVYWLRTFGYQPGSRSFTQRIYLLYLGGYGLFWVVAMWSFAADQSLWIGTLLPPAVTQGIAGVIPWLILAAQVFLAFRYAADSPLKLSFEDIAYVAGSPLSRGVIALLGFVQSILPVLIVAVPAAAWIPLALNRSPEAAGWAGAQAVIAVLPLAVFTWGLAWIAGLARLAFPAVWRPLPLRLLVLAALPLALLAPDVFLYPGRVLAAASLGQLALPDLVGLWLLVLPVVAAIPVLGGRVSLVDVVDESAVFARIHALGLMAWGDPRLAQRIRQQAASASRQPALYLPGGAGVKALVLRAGLAYVRRPMALLTALIWGGLAAQLCALLVFQGAGAQAWITLLAFPILAPPGGLVRVFQNDREEPFLRQLLPHSNLCLLLADAAAPAAALLIGALGVWMIQPLPVGVTLAGGLLIVSVTALLTLCQGASLVRLTDFRISVPYQLLALLAFGAVLAAGFALETVLASVVMVILIVVSFAAAIRSSPLVG